MSRKRKNDTKLLRLQLRHPRVGLAMAEAGAWLRWWSGCWSFRDRKSLPTGWVGLFAPMAPSRARRLSLGYAVHCAKNALLWKLLKRGKTSAISGMIKWKHLDRIRQPLEDGRPVIIAGWHVGAWFVLPLALRTLDRPLTLLMLGKSDLKPPADWEVLSTAEGGEGGVVAFRRCVQRLRTGGPVAMICDIYTDSGSGLPVTVVGVDLHLRRGFAALSRATGALIVPVSLRWDKGCRLVCEALPPLSSSEGDRSDRESFEARVIAEYGERLDAEIRARPSSVWPPKLGTLMEARNRQAMEVRAPVLPGVG